MAGPRDALEAERKVEQEFVERARQSEKAPKGWPAALVMFHLGMWRERLRNALTDAAEGRPHTAPDDVDAVNEAELPMGIGTPLADAAARSDRLLGEIIELYERMGDRPFNWFTATTTTEAVLRNSYSHARLHLVEYWKENGEPERANRLFDDALSDMRAADAPPIVLGTAVYNGACAKVSRGEAYAALELLKEAISLRPALKEVATSDPDLERLHDDPRFQELIK